VSAGEKSRLPSVVVLALVNEWPADEEDELDSS
jgi:hypothetical protein